MLKRANAKKAKIEHHSEKATTKVIAFIQTLVIRRMNGLKSTRPALTTNKVQSNQPGTAM